MNDFTTAYLSGLHQGIQKEAVGRAGRGAIGALIGAGIGGAAGLGVHHLTGGNHNGMPFRLPIYGGIAGLMGGLAHMDEAELAEAMEKQRADILARQDAGEEISEVDQNNLDYINNQLGFPNG